MKVQNPLIFELIKRAIILCEPELIKGTEPFLRSETFSRSLALKK